MRATSRRLAPPAGRSPSAPVAASSRRLNLRVARERRAGGTHGRGPGSNPADTAHEIPSRRTRRRCWMARGLVMPLHCVEWGYAGGSGSPCLCPGLLVFFESLCGWLSHLLADRYRSPARTATVEACYKVEGEAAFSRAITNRICSALPRPAPPGAPNSFLPSNLMERN